MRIASMCGSVSWAVTLVTSLPCRGRMARARPRDGAGRPDPGAETPARVSGETSPGLGRSAAAHASPGHLSTLLSECPSKRSPNARRLEHGEALVAAATPEPRRVCATHQVAGECAARATVPAAFARPAAGGGARLVARRWPAWVARAVRTPAMPAAQLRANTRTGAEPGFATGLGRRRSGRSAPKRQVRGFIGSLHEPSDDPEDMP
jgi:hypothetical protein